jgi:RNA polymerase sigma-70 factor, ECF subfamily
MGSSDAGEPAGLAITADDFVTLLVRCERRVRAFVTTLHPHSHDVDEVVQDTCLVAWKKRDGFRYNGSKPDECFVRWLCSIARFEVNNLRRRRGEAALAFDDELIDKLADQYIEYSPRLESRHQALMDCLQRLRPRDQEMVKRRYQVGVSARELASLANRTVDAVYKALTRIRGALMVCIEHRLKEENLR